MARGVEALITPEILVWAREKSRLSIDLAAKRVQVTEEKLLAWESGELLPTVNQARKLAEVYHRPFAVFYMEEPPVDFDTLKDFRKLDVDEEREYSTELSWIIRRKKEQQEWLHDYLLEQEMDKLHYIAKYSIDDNPRDVAKYIISILTVDLNELSKIRKRSELLRRWIEIFEANRVYVSKSAKVELEECRGFVLIDEVSPMIFLNNRDAEAGQLFTLIHEFVHLLLGESAIENSKVYGYYVNAKYDAVETFCNRVSSYVLLNEQSFNQTYSELDGSLPVEDKIRKLSSKFLVSEEAIARRLLDNGNITSSKYKELRHDYNERWKAIYSKRRRKMKKQDGGPSYYITQVSNNGRVFTGIVLNAYLGNRIACRSVSNLLNTKINNLGSMAEIIGMRYFS